MDLHALDARPASQPEMGAPPHANDATSLRERLSVARQGAAAARRIVATEMLSLRDRAQMVRTAEAMEAEASQIEARLRADYLAVCERALRAGA